MASVAKVDLEADADNNAAMVPEDQQQPEGPQQQEGDVEEEPTLDTTATETNGSLSTQLTFVDHFSLRGPSSTVRFRGTKVTIYEQSGEEQFLLEEQTRVVKNEQTGEPELQLHITAKSMHSGSFGLRILRVGYTLVATLMLGFLFVLCFQILLFLFVNLPVTVGETAGSSVRADQFIGTVLSIPLFLHSMGSVMAYASTFVTDTWNGHKLFRDMMEWPEMLEEWISFIIFLAVPAITILVTLFMGLDTWWEISSYTWMVCVFVFFLFFSVVTLSCEVTACWETVALLEKDKLGHASHYQAWYSLLWHSVLWTQRQRFAGIREERYLVHGAEPYPALGYALSPDHTPEQTRTSIYTHVTRWLTCAFVRRDNAPKRVYTVEEIRDIVPFVTRANWSLEKTFCLSKDARVIYATTGPQALEVDQAQSSLVCTAFGLLLLTLLLVGGLVWFGSPARLVIVFALLLFYFCAMPTIRSSWNVFRTYQAMRNVDRSANDPDEEDIADVLYQVWETVAVTQPKDWYCWMRTGLDFVFLYLWPLVGLATTEQYPILVLFFFLGIFSALRVYCNASFVLSELGCLSDLNLFDAKQTDDDESDGGKYSFKRKRGLSRLATDRSLLAKARTSNVIGNITRSRVAGRWRTVYAILALGVFFLFALAADEEVTTPKGGRPPIVQVDDFYYPPQPELPYPSCKMSNTFALPSPNETAARLGDFSYLAALAYETKDVSQHYLNTWFGEGQLVDEADFVASWRQEMGNDENPVFFKLYSIRDLPGYGIVAIRGSQTKTDFLVDAQLWSSAFLAQIVQAMIPMGWLWTSILDDLVRVVNFVESARCERRCLPYLHCLFLTLLSVVASMTTASKRLPTTR